VLNNIPSPKQASSNNNDTVNFFVENRTISGNSFQSFSSSFSSSFCVPKMYTIQYIINHTMANGIVAGEYYFNLVVNGVLCKRLVIGSD